MKLNIFKLFLFSLCITALFTSCVEDDGWDELGDEGSSFIKFLEGPEKSNFFSPFTDVRKVNAFTLRKDASTSEALNQTATVKLANDQSIIDNYNEEHGTNYEVLPASFYKLTNTNFKPTSTGYDITFGGAGNFSQEFNIELDGSKWTDLSKKYALAFRVQDAPGLVETVGKDSILVLFAIKNRWDGVYEVTKGTLADAVVPTLTHINDYLNSKGLGNAEWELQTISETECILYDPEVGGDLYPITSGGTSASAYGAFGLIFKFDPVTNAIVEVRNAKGQPAGNTRRADLDPSGVNAYDPATKTINVSWFMRQPSVVPAAPNIRVTATEEMTFVRERE